MTRSGVIKIYQPWTPPVRAACYDAPATLPVIDHWVRTLHQAGRIPPDVRFAIRADPGSPIGVLTDARGEQELHPSGFLVHNAGDLQILDAPTFWRRYQEPTA